MAGKRHSTIPVGPFSRDRRLVEATVDRRTKVGRLFRTTVADLSDQIGGAPTPAQSLIIQSAALKACRLYLLSEKLLDGGEIGEKSDHNALAWLNSMRLDLTALGLARQIRDIGPTLADIIAQHEANDEVDGTLAADMPDVEPNGAGDLPSAAQEAAE